MDFTLPAWLNLPPAALLAGAVGIASLVWAVSYTLLGFMGPMLEAVPGTTMIRLCLRRVRAPLAMMIGAIAFIPLIAVTGLEADTQTALMRAAIVVLTLGAGIAAYRLSQLAFDISSRLREGVDLAEDVHTRRRQTRLNMLRRLASIAIALTTLAIIFMSLPALRAIGVSLLASAGVAGIAIGLAARPAISNLLAGIQIAFSEPIRIGDQVVLEGEWGTVEDITSTYVVVNIWDQRRLILPLTYFLEKPFQNWTRENPQILGTAMFYVDYSVPIEEMRHELDRILHETKLWDGRAVALQVTDLRENTVEVRALMSARNAPSAFDLRCYVREKLIEWMRSEYPHALPRTRFAVDHTLLQVPGMSRQAGGDMPLAHPQ